MVCSSPSPPERLALSPGIPGEEVADSVVDPELELPASSFLLSGLKVINYINFRPIKTYKTVNRFAHRRFSQKTNEQIFFFGFTVRKYLKLEIKISSFKYFSTV